MKAKTPQDIRILELIEPIAEGLGLEIVRVRTLGSKRVTLQIMAQRDDGTMNVDACAALSRGISALFDETDPISGEYNLEVSSPGIDRPLTAPHHFDQWEGFEAKLELDRMVEGRKRFKGVLAGTEDDNVLIDLEGEEDTAVIPFAWIYDAKLVMTDELMKASAQAAGASDSDDTNLVQE
ncbi:ribosome maturation factor RimP [Woodsholea maritima]|uniref:ribosome maturation factor RimP n=1 Tax=Woodsholea maritima TaxID=240237 RepID=UPI000478253A|nr:ribosome maturation factor RimP [Woodsholea maritima]